MPWMETCAMDERIRFVLEATVPGVVMTEVCGRFGMSGRRVTNDWSVTGRKGYGVCSIGLARRPGAPRRWVNRRQPVSMCPRRGYSNRSTPKRWTSVVVVRGEIGASERVAERGPAGEIVARRDAGQRDGFPGGGLRAAA